MKEREPDALRGRAGIVAMVRAAPEAAREDLPEDDDEIGAGGPRSDEARVHRLRVDAGGSGVRIDKYLAARLVEFSRSRIQRWIDEGAILRNGAVAQARTALSEGDRIEVRESPLPENLAFTPEAMELPVVWEDESILVIDKPAGLVVHPGAGNWSGTLLNGLLARDSGLSEVPRAGIVHRLDAGTSGLLVVARTPAAHADLVRQLQERSVLREYWALAAGDVAPSVTIDSALARDPRNPLRFRVSRSVQARPARTFVRRLAQLRDPESTAMVSWIACRLDTGRTHQIRVHLESIGHPLLGDPVYRNHLPATLAAGRWLARQALHACRLEIVHPVSRKAMAWSSAPPEDMASLLRRLGVGADRLRPQKSAF